VKQNSRKSDKKQATKTESDEKLGNAAKMCLVVYPMAPNC
jgi:hypothetical protein